MDGSTGRGETASGASSAPASVSASDASTTSAAPETDPARGAIGGASDDAGVEYRRAVAAYLVAAAIDDAGFLELGVPPQHSQVASVALETDDAVDDIRLRFETGHTCYFQARRRVQLDKRFRSAADQWSRAVKSGLDPEQSRLVIVTGSASGPVAQIQRFLERYQASAPGDGGALTGEEARARDALDSALSGLSPAERKIVYRCAQIWVIDVEEPHSPGARLGATRLQHRLVTPTAGAAHAAWLALVAVAGETARLRSGRGVTEWVDALNGRGIDLVESGDNMSPAVGRAAALRRYRERVGRRGNYVDLRGLAADLPPLPLTDCDADLDVSTSETDSRKTAPSLWAFMRRHRMILTGLPGGGKSTELRKLAAQLCELPHAPLPVFVPLSKMVAVGSFRDRLLDAATSDASVEDRESLRLEIDRRLQDGSAALILDSLDETYDQRSHIVRELDDFTRDISDDVAIVLSTRDVAYGQAATLGWRTVRLNSPNPKCEFVGAILDAAAVANVPDAGRAAWVSERRRWVSVAMRSDAQLHETPLVPTLLALLAIERSPERLPRHRAEILAAVISDLIERHEKDRDRGGPTARDEAIRRSMRMFALEGHLLVQRDNRATRDDLATALTADVASYWGQAPGVAADVAEAAIRFFDESGVFVIEGAEEVVRPRISLFAEIGDALWMTKHGGAHADPLREWVGDRVTRCQFEPLTLAAALEPTVMEHLIGHLGIPADSAPVDAAVDGQVDKTSDKGKVGEVGIDLLTCLVRATREGAVLREDQTVQLGSALAQGMRSNTRDGWECWALLEQLAVPADLYQQIEEAAAMHSPEHVTLVRAVLHLRNRKSGTELVGTEPTDDDLLLALLHIARLPSPPSADGDSSWNTFVRSSDTLTPAQLQAAKVMVSRSDEAPALIAKLAREAPHQYFETFLQILRDQGFEELADREAESARMSENTLKWIHGWSVDVHLDLIRALVARAPRAVADIDLLSWRERISCHELARLLETVNVNDGGSQTFLKRPMDWVLAVVDVAATTYGFDINLATAQATVVLDRCEHTDDTDPYFALFDLATAGAHADWAHVEDPEGASRLLVDCLTTGTGQAWFAARTLIHSPVADLVAPLVRHLVDGLDGYHEHQRIAALCMVGLAQSIPMPEPLSWASSPNPTLRAVLAHTFPADSGKLPDGLLDLLSDEDGYVRENAIKRAARLSPPDLPALLESASGALPVGWTCLSCGTKNAPAQVVRGCSKEDCYRAGPDVAETVAKLTAQLAT